jgi:hypothetical protein
MAIRWNELNRGLKRAQLLYYLAGTVAKFFYLRR